MVNGHCVRTLHAESNAIAWAKEFVGSVHGMYLLATHYPCLLCTKEIIREGLSRVYYLNPYGPTEEVVISRGLYLAKNIQVEHLVMDI
jgi:dCMP deaminase